MRAAPSLGQTRIVMSCASLVVDDQPSRAARARVAQLLVGDVGGVFGPQLDGPLAGSQLRVADGEAAIAALLEAVDRHPVLPHAQEQAAADLVGRHLVGEHHRGVGVRLQDQPVDAVEQGLVVGGDGVDVVPHGVINRSIMRASAVRWREAWSSRGLPGPRHRVRRQLQTAHSGRFCSQPHTLPSQGLQCGPEHSHPRFHAAKELRG
jgi:hypothetical protein